MIEKNKSITMVQELDLIEFLFLGLMDFKDYSSVFYKYFFLFLLVSCCFCAHSEIAIEHLIPLVIAKLPHDSQAFTQGLAIEEDQLYESTGLYQQSSLRHLNLLTGQVIQQSLLPSHIFAEGLAAFPHFLLQITWKEQRAFIYDRSSLRLQKVLYYSGEGWGLCRDGDTIWMSNGTSTLTQRDLQTFTALKTLSVSLSGEPVVYLNDLESDGNYLYANIWQKDWLIRIDKMTGKVTGIIDASHLLSAEEKALLGPNDVLNGIAFRSKTETFFITGKGWPWIFEVRFVPQKPQSFLWLIKPRTKQVKKNEIQKGLIGDE